MGAAAHDQRVGDGLINPAGVAFGPGGAIVVANDVFNGSVREFAPGADGNVAPVRTLAGTATALSEPFGLAIDSAGEVWVADVGNSSIFVFAANASGNTAPVRFITGAATGLSLPDALALDGAGDVLVADEQGRVEDFAAGVSGKQVSPFGSLAGSQTGIVIPVGVAISPPLLGISTATLPAATVGTAYSQTVGASGGVRPYRFSLASGALPAGVTALNAATATATGNAAPIGLIAGGNTTLDFPHGVDVDAQGRIYVPNQFGNSIAVCSRPTRPGACCRRRSARLPIAGR